MKRHVTDRFRRRPSFEQSDRHVFVVNGDAVFKFNGQAQRMLEPFRAAFWTGNSQSEMTNCSNPERDLHGRYVSRLGGDAKFARRISDFAHRRLPADPNVSRNSSQNVHAARRDHPAGGAELLRRDLSNLGQRFGVVSLRQSSSRSCRKRSISQAGFCLQALTSSGQRK
jgi:hypothetical protein